MTIVRRLTRSGVSIFADFLTSHHGEIRTDNSPEVPFSLLDSEEHSESLHSEVTVKQREFINRFELGEYLHSRLEPLAAELEQWDGLWSWLGLYYFDQICPVGTTIFRDHRYVFDADYGKFSYTTSYRHLLYTPHDLVRRHGGEVGRALLANNVHQGGDAAESIMSRADVRQSKGVLGAIDMLYYDEETDNVKRGAAVRSAPGSIDRFQKVLRQYERTHDVMVMESLAIVNLLPEEFDGWSF